MAFSGTIKGRDTHEAVHARFRFKPAKGVFALDQKGRGFDAGFFAHTFFNLLHTHAARLCPAHVHAAQHIGPVLAFGATGPSVDFQIGVIAIGFTRQKRF